MKIDATNNYAYTNQQTNSLAVSNNTAALSAAINTVSISRSEVSETKQADFNSMTNQEMRSWVNEQLRNGEMSLDDSRAFMAMTMRIPVNGGNGSELQAMNDGERFNFMQKAHNGVQAALARNDKESIRMLESAILLMQKHQGKTIGIDTLA